MNHSNDHSNRNNMKIIASKAVLASAVAAALGVAATDSEAGIWDQCADNASNCESEASSRKDQCLQDAKADAQKENETNYCTNDEIAQDFREAEARCNATYEEDVRKCGDEFNSACSW